jgi:hypothetical protein
VRESKLAAQVGVTVESAVDPQVFNAAIDALLGLPGFSHFEKLVDKLSTTQLNEEEKKLLRLALDRLGLKDYEADASVQSRCPPGPDPDHFAGSQEPSPLLRVHELREVRRALQLDPDASDCLGYRRSTATRSPSP